MNTDVFSRKDVGDFVNEKFISVKVQLDKTSKDNEYVKSWYDAVALIQKEYGVVSLPTFLFFSPNGEFVHRIPGAHDAASFIALSAEALDPNKQYFSFRNKLLRSSKIEPEQLKKLATMAIGVFEKEDARKFANQYLATQTDLFTKENASFLYRFTWSGKDKGFDILLKHGDKIDAQLWAGAANEKLLDIIFIEELYPLVAASGNATPDWKAIEQTIAAKYPSQAGPVLSLYKANYYLGKNDTKNFEQSVLEYMRMYGLHVSAVQLNTFARALFERSSDKDALNEALEWSGRSVISNELSRQWRYDPRYRNSIFTSFLSELPGYLNTYANLLHKLGRTKEAIPVMEKAYILTEGQEKENYGKILEKMKTGEQTW
jgi:thioredoxin-related protein